MRKTLQHKLAAVASMHRAVALATAPAVGQPAPQPPLGAGTALANAQGYWRAGRWHAYAKPMRPRANVYGAR